MAKPKEYYEKPEQCGYRKPKHSLDPFDNERNPRNAFYRENQGGREVDWAVEDRKNAKKPRNTSGS